MVNKSTFSKTIQVVKFDLLKIVIFMSKHKPVRSVGFGKDSQDRRLIYAASLLLLS